MDLLCIELQTVISSKSLLLKTERLIYLFLDEGILEQASIALLSELPIIMHKSKISTLTGQDNSFSKSNLMLYFS